MKTSELLPYAAILCFSLCIFVGCTSRADIDRINHAESIMSVNPDSALAIIETVDPSQLHTPEHRAHYALVRQYSRYKSGIDDRNDSIISVASDYYSRHSPYSREALLADITHAFTLRNDSAYFKALALLRRAEPVAIALGDSFQLATVCREFAALYNLIGNGNEAVAYARRSADLMKCYPDSSYRWDAICNIAMYLNNQQNYAEAVRIAAPFVAKALAAGDRQVLEKALSVCAHANIPLGNFKQSAECFHLIDSLQLPKQNYFKCNYAHALSASGQKALARKLLTLPDGTIDTINAPASFWRVNGDYENALKSVYRTIDFKDSIIQACTRQEVTHQYHQHLESINAEQSRQLQQRRMLIYSALFLIILLSALIFAIRKSASSRIHRLEAEKSNMLLDIQRIRTLEADCKISEPASLVKLQFDTLDRLFNAYLKTNENAEKEKIYRSILATFQQLGSDRCFQLIESHLNLNHDSIMHTLDQALPELSSAERKVFVYSACGLSPRSIAAILSLSANNISVIKSRLRKKIKSTSSPKTDKFLDLLA